MPGVLVGGAVTTRAEGVLAELARLQRDPEPAARAVGAALTAAALDTLHDDERRWVDDIEALRAELEVSEEPLDTALVNRRGEQRPWTLGEVCRRRSKKRPWGVFLLALARTLGPERCVELGTCLGISSAYLGAGLRLAGGGRLVTLEGAPALAERARKHLAALGLADVEVETGLFADTLDAALTRCSPVDLAFVDGHHQEEPTLDYFERIASVVGERAVVVFDDIRWSEGMERAWAALTADPRVHVAVDLTSVGVCVVGPPGDQPARVYRFPTVTSVQACFPPGDDAVPRPRFRPVPGERARLNWGCGPKGEPGWVNADLARHPSVELTGDIRDGLPVDDDCFEYVVSIHALPMVPLPDVPDVLAELRRVLRPGGTLRLGLPDLDRGIDAYRRGDGDYFLVPDRDAETLSGKLVTQLLWYGYSVSLFTPEFAEELLRRAGFAEVRRCGFRQTASGLDGITDLDDRENESFFVEAVK